MGRNNSSTSLDAAFMGGGDVFHIRSVSNLSTRSEGSVSRSDISGPSSIASDNMSRKVQSIAEFPPPSAGFVSGSTEDVSSKRIDSTPRHSFCNDTCKLANDDFIDIQQDNLKLVVLGDSAVGKTSLLTSFTTDKIPETHAPTIYDKFTGKYMHGQGVCNRRLYLPNIN